MHDARMLAVSDLYDDLENFAFCPAGREMCLYGDPAYPLRVDLTLVAIDEAHCVSQWGYGFRSSYRSLGCIRDKLPTVREYLKIFDTHNKFQFSRITNV